MLRELITGVADLKKKGKCTMVERVAATDFVLVGMEGNTEAALITTSLITVA